MESLVDEKVDAFWRGVDSEASKSGQIIVTFSEKKQKKTTWFQVYAGEVHLFAHLSVLQPLKSSLYRRRSHGNNGTLVASNSSYNLSFLCRIISAEIRQPKSDQGEQYLQLQVLKGV